MEQKKPLLSIGMPVYNAEEHIGEAIDSILVQTFTNYELIICDNASTDKTQEICQNYVKKDDRIQYHQNTNNLGASKNYNRVFELAAGKYFKWAAHDDIMAPKFLESCIHTLDQNPDVVVCYPSTKLIDESGYQFGTYRDDLNLHWAQAHKRFRKFFNTQGLCHPVFGVIRNETLKRTALIGNYPASDRVLIGELALYGQFIELPEYLFLRRIHPKISTVANTNVNQIAAWFDPKKTDKIVFSRWRRLREYITAIIRAPLNWSERVLCFAQLSKYVFFPKRWAGLFGDIMNAGKIAFSRLRANRN